MKQGKKREKTDLQTQSIFARNPLHKLYLFTLCQIMRKFLTTRSLLFEAAGEKCAQQSWGSGAHGECCEQLGHVAGLPGLPASLNLALHAQDQIAFTISH